jgi:CHAD domain-containing protein
VSFQLKPEERVDRGVRRLARKELRDARRTLGRARPPTPDAIHETRKSLKKVRAIVQLVDVDGADGIRKAKRRLRKVARKLSDLRDADAMFEIVNKLKGHDRRLFDTGTTKRLRTWLSRRRQRALSVARQKDRWSSVADELQTVRRSAKDWRALHHAFGLLSRGIARTHRRGRKALMRALKRQRADDFHRLRKQIKTLWYELRLFQPAARPIARDVRALHRAETWLGDDHNVVVLCAALSKGNQGQEIPVSLDRLKDAADRYHAQARKKALAAVRHIYERKSRPYVRNLKRMWNAWPAQKATA